MARNNIDSISPNISNQQWKIVGLVILCIRFVQGWIFWAGGSRRFIYAPQKLDPHAANWLANKLQSAMPGALLGVGHIISYMLQHFIVLYIAIILFSFAELICGIALIVGFFTRSAAFVTALISIILMLVFGWEGSTCVDEWSMAVSNLSMALVLMLSGASIYSMDSWLLHRYPALQQHWFPLVASGSWPYQRLKRVAIMCLVFTIVFTVATYNYYRGAVISPYHAGPVSPTQFHLTLSNGWVAANGTVNFTVYVNGGTTAVPSHIIRIELLSDTRVNLETWTTAELSNLSAENIKNKYRYNRITMGPYGLIAPVSATADIKLVPIKANLQLTPGNYELQIYTINGHRWDLRLNETAKWNK